MHGQVHAPASRRFKASCGQLSQACSGPATASDAGGGGGIGHRVWPGAWGREGDTLSKALAEPQL
uniref:Uncharacterized protein n=1 Tax=Mustela putorius furo TaxID=9669 RepID=M3YQ26_MUSPF